jgi:hypothetical protein
MTTTGFADSHDHGGSHRLGLRGSFIARITDRHLFQLGSDAYSTDNLWNPDTEFHWEGTELGMAEGTWNPPAQDLLKDFRYRLEIETNLGYTWVQISVGVAFTDHEMALLDGDLIAICHQSGCRDLSLEQVPYACQPDPSQSPEPTRSHTPTGTASSGFAHSAVIHNSYSPVDSALCTPSMNLADSLSRDGSPRFLRSQKFEGSASVYTADVTESPQFGDSPSLYSANVPDSPQFERSAHFLTMARVSEVPAFSDAFERTDRYRPTLIFLSADPLPPSILEGTADPAAGEVTAVGASAKLCDSRVSQLSLRLAPSNAFVPTAAFSDRASQDAKAAGRELGLPALIGIVAGVIALVVGIVILLVLRRVRANRSGTTSGMAMDASAPSLSDSWTGAITLPRSICETCASPLFTDLPADQIWQE